MDRAFDVFAGNFPFAAGAVNLSEVDAEFFGEGTHRRYRFHRRRQLDHFLVAEGTDDRAAIGLWRPGFGLAGFVGLDRHQDLADLREIAFLVV